MLWSIMFAALCLTHLMLEKVTGRLHIAVTDLPSIDQNVRRSDPPPDRSLVSARLQATFPKNTL